MRGSMEHTACSGGRERLGCPGPLLWRRGAFRKSFLDGIIGGEGRGIGRKEAGSLHLEIEIEVHLRPFENLFLYTIVFRLL